MAKLTHSDLTSIIGAETSAITTINANGALTETALENTLSRDGTSPNTMSVELDMNSNDINNVDTVRTTALTVNGIAIATAGMVWQGAWVTTTIYAVDEGISNNGSSYICILAHTAGTDNDEPGVGSSTDTYWNEFAAKGDTGASGGDVVGDDVFRIQDDGDATKELAFEVSGIATMTTRTWTVPNTNVTFGAYTDTLVNVANEAAFKTATNLEIGTDVQAQNALLADIAGLTLTNGDIIYYDGSNFVKLDNGTTGQFLQTKGVAAPVWANAIWVESVAEQEPAAVASVVAEGLTGRTQEIIYSLKPVTDGADLYLTVGHGGTPTYLAGTSYDFAGLGADDTGTSKDWQGAGGAQIILHRSDGVGNNTDEFISGRITIYNFDETQHSQFTGIVAYSDAAGQSYMGSIGGAVLYSANALTAIKLAFSSGNIASGYITVNKLD